MLPANPTPPKTELTPEERRELRRLCREKQRERAEAVRCSGWRHWKWRNLFYQGVPQPDWFKHYSNVFDTVEINASFYSWAPVADVPAWRDSRAPDISFTRLAANAPKNAKALHCLLQTDDKSRPSSTLLL